MSPAASPTYPLRGESEGDEITVGPDPEDLYVFHPETGVSLTEDH